MYATKVWLSIIIILPPTPSSSPDLLFHTYVLPFLNKISYLCSFFLITVSSILYFCLTCIGVGTKGAMAPSPLNISNTFTQK